MSSQSRITTPVEAGKVGAFYDPVSKVITHLASFPVAGNIVSSIPVVIASSNEELESLIQQMGLTRNNSNQ